MSKRPSDFLEEIIIGFTIKQREWQHRLPNPGDAIKYLGDESRETLKRLTSDSIAEVREPYLCVGREYFEELEFRKEKMEFDKKLNI